MIKQFCEVPIYVSTQEFYFYAALSQVSQSMQYSNTET